MSILFRSGLAAKYRAFPFSLSANRKLVTVQARQIDASKADQVADLLCHKRTTANAHYDVTDQR
ncbi:hypothetical protein DPMN_045531 [Dreissena polymorpha]|uniref:Uncharacterized protein n=1 Tax=Dreissena polymorpha TaxID=45954 RepID=A0A9D4D7Y9_DREPO|nr:hypothetical protein DPMN_045531 [Dreissena polymorpha]